MELMVDTAQTQGQTQSQGGQAVSPPSIFPYRFTSDGRLCHRVTQEPFMFQRGCDPDVTQREDQALCLHVTQHVHSLLEEQLHLVSQGYVYLSPGALESPANLLVVVQDRGTVRCGLWSWRAAASEGLERGSMIPYVRRVLEEGSSVLLMNPNQGGGAGETPEEHVHRVWDLMVSRCVSRRVVVVAHGYGGLAFVDLLCRRPQQVVTQVWAAAFLDSSHSLWHQPLDAAGREWLRTRSRRWVLSSKPLNQPVGSLKAGCPQMSAGTQSHDAAPSVCMESVFRFFSKTLSPKPPTTFSMVTRSRGTAGQIRPHSGRGITGPY
ncbi:cotranscriptional regulator FAM172A homolog [Salmo salar]|uniref:Cotranscriptional regulator FAM172A homolog n=1 Tax=Salmo salar TaxID=8030 RepID=A0A1S3MU04_SALSA|nr:cotranscriptional regulator FAM172A homolog [Salmo salar]|eukprot:XP_014006649.1 PREDICTED: protein FAM172A-like [Salmo salar]